jgi:hypothetical protein
MWKQFSPCVSGLSSTSKPFVILSVFNFGNDFCESRIIDSRTLMKVKVKVKCTLVQALRLCTGCTARRGSRGIAPLFYDQRH